MLGLIRTQVLGEHRIQQGDEVTEHVKVPAHPNVDDTAVLLGDGERG